MEIISRLFGISKKEESFVNDRRCAKRYDMHLKLNYLDPETMEQGETVTKNISKTGLRFPIDKKFSTCDILHLKIEDPNSTRHIKSKAQVVWMEQFFNEGNAEEPVYETGIRLLSRKLF